MLRSLVGSEMCIRDRCNPNRPAPMITVVTTNSTRADRAVTAVPQIPPPRQYPRQVYIIFLLLGKGDFFLNPLSIHIAHHSRQLSSVSASTHTVVLCDVLPSITPAVIFCRSLLPRPQLSVARHLHLQPRQFFSASFSIQFHLLILTPNGLRSTPYQCP